MMAKAADCYNINKPLKVFHNNNYTHFNFVCRANDEYWRKLVPASGRTRIKQLADISK